MVPQTSGASPLALAALQSLADRRINALHRGKRPIVAQPPYSPSIFSRIRLGHSRHRQSDKMPTPESEIFKSQKPKVAPTFNGVDYDDTKAFKQAEDAIIREQWVDAMKTRLVGEELGKCYMREGVNHLENCGQLRGESEPSEDGLRSALSGRAGIAC